MKLIIILFSFFLILNLAAQSDFDSYKNEQTTQHESYIKEMNLAEANYYSRQDSLFIQYKDEIERLWNEFKESTPKEWVSYNADFSGRSEVDFEKSEIKVAAVVDEKASAGEKEQQKARAQEIVKQQLISIMKEKDELSDEPILAGQVQSPVNDSAAIKEKDLDIIATKIVKESKPVVIKTKDGNKLKYEITLNLMPNNIITRVEKYKSTIEAMCEKHDVNPKVAMAIIHTESFYNPKAYNRHGNAYGLMQIVPKYAGTTMNYALFKKKGKPSSDQLFDAKTNLDMGIGYMRWLADNKWSKVTNKNNQYYAIICSYNGGPGCVYKAMTGKMTKIGQDKWDKMMSDLSNMDNDELYEKLHRDVPWKETRNYIKLVKERMDKYYNY